MSTAPANSIPGMPSEVPASFFEGLPQGVAPPSNLPRTRETSTSALPTAPMRALMLYDAIIDDILANPSTSLAATAQRLRKGPSTISMVVRSDFFKARWLQRREQFNEEMSFRLTRKITEVVERSLESTARALQTKGENVPLPVLNDINKTLLDRLGYAPSSTPSAGSGAVNVHVNASPVASAGAVAASPEGLAAARESLKKLEAVNAASDVKPSSVLGTSDDVSRSAGLVVEGEATRVAET